MIGLSAAGEETLVEFPWEFGENTSLCPWIVFQAPQTHHLTRREGKSVRLGTKFSVWLCEQYMIS